MIPDSKTSLSQAWQLTPIIQALGRLNQENCSEFEVTPDCKMTDFISQDNIFGEFFSHRNLYLD